jgi:hypothetical protein
MIEQFRFKVEKLIDPQFGESRAGVGLLIKICCQSVS